MIALSRHNAVHVSFGPLTFQVIKIESPTCFLISHGRNSHNWHQRPTLIRLQSNCLQPPSSIDCSARNGKSLLHKMPSSTASLPEHSHHIWPDGIALIARSMSWPSLASSHFPILFSALSQSHISMLIKGLCKAKPSLMPNHLPLTSDVLARNFRTLRAGYLSPL